MPCATKELQREYQRKWIANRRKEWFKDKQCIDCKSKEELEIDHRDRLQKVSNSVWSWSEARRAVELAKCDVRCSNCHKKRHAKRPWSSSDGRRFDQGPPNTHWCGTHRQYIPAENFSLNRNRWNGVEDRCVECRSMQRSPRKFARETGSTGRAPDSKPGITGSESLVSRQVSGEVG
jgi:hypothetical protein